MSNKGGDGVYKKLMALAKDKYMMLKSPSNYFAHFGLSLVGIHIDRSVLGGNYLVFKIL